MIEEVSKSVNHPVFLLVHYEGNEAVSEPKVIGVFSSATDARECIHFVMGLDESSYRLVPEGFAVQEFTLGKPFSMKEL